MKASLVSLVWFVVFLITTQGCGDKENKSSASSDKKNVSQKKSEAPKKPSERLSTRTWRPLLSEALRAELDIDGLVIDFGTYDQHKYTRGGWKSGWGKSHNTDGISYIQTEGKESTLFFWLRKAPKKLIVRARTAGGKASRSNVRVSLGKHTLINSIEVGQQWSTIQAPLENFPEKFSRAKLLLQSSTPIDIDWLWLSEDSEANDYTPIPRTLPIRFSNGSRRALTAPSSRAYSFYLHVPPQAKLIVDIGSDQEARFTIHAQTSAGNQELLSKVVNKGQWHEQVIDLSEFSGQAMRLEFFADAPMGKTGWGEPEIVIPKAKTEPTLGKRAKNLVFVVMDTTRADSFASVDPKTIVSTPQYDALAKKSTTFKNAYNNENWTKPSVTTMWSGLYPDTHGARHATSHVDKSIRFLPQQLQDNGFTTGAFIANAVVSKTFGFDKGWTHFQNDSDHNLDGNGSKLYPHAAQWMEAHKDERFFLYVQSVDPHTSYRVPDEYSSKYYKGKYKGSIGPEFDREEQMKIDNSSMKISDNDLAWIWALYRGEVSYQDKYLGELIHTIDELGLSENTLIVITNDHGEEIRDHGTMGHGWPLYEEQIRAPLLMSYPPIFEPGANVSTIVEHADLAPSILDALGVAPMKSAEGLSFLPVLQDQVGKRQHPFYTVAWSRKAMRSVRVGDWKLIVGKSSDWMNLYNLKKDPKELNNLIQKKKGPTEEAMLPGRLCEIYLAETLATPDKARRLENAGQKQSYNSKQIPIDDKTRKELEALGYL